jgi:hypothetical protein
LVANEFFSSSATMMEPVILATNAKGQVWQQVKTTIEIM